MPSSNMLLLLMKNMLPLAGFTTTPQMDGAVKYVLPGVCHVPWLMLKSHIVALSGELNDRARTGMALYPRSAIYITVLSGFHAI